MCPLVCLCGGPADSSGEADATLPSAERMMAEQGVKLVIQLDPFLPTDDDAVTQDRLLSLTSRRGCGVWPVQAGYADLTIVRHEPRHCLMEFRYTLPLDKGTEVRHVWYYCWRDFSVPRPGDRGAIRETAQLAAQVMDQGGKVMLTCHAGRGRSGTLAAVIVGLQRGLGTHGDLVDAIVAMRCVGVSLRGHLGGRGVCEGDSCLEVLGSLLLTVYFSCRARVHTAGRVEMAWWRRRNSMRSSGTC